VQVRKMTIIANEDSGRHVSIAPATLLVVSHVAGSEQDSVESTTSANPSLGGAPPWKGHFPGWFTMSLEAVVPMSEDELAL